MCACACMCALALQTRAARGEGRELSEREAGCVYAGDRTGAPARPPRGTHIVQLLSSVRLQFLSGSFLNLMCTGMFLCTAAADDDDDDDGLGNANET